MHTHPFLATLATACLMAVSSAATAVADPSLAGMLDSLAEAPLARPIGSQAAYANFVSMLLSLAVARACGTEFEATLMSRLLEPAQMRGAFIPDQAQRDGTARDPAAFGCRPAPT